jgi:hypothetical protein
MKASIWSTTTDSPNTYESRYVRMTIDADCR